MLRSASTSIVTARGTSWGDRACVIGKLVECGHGRQAEAAQHSDVLAELTKPRSSTLSPTAARRDIRRSSLTHTNIFVYCLFMTNRREVPKPTEGELELLTILWDRGEATVRELFDAVNTRRQVVYTGVLKLLQIMTDKGLVERNESERAHVYRSAVAKEETQQRFMREISDRFFAGSAGKLALRALEMEAASEEDLNEIRKLLRRKREK